MTPIEYIAITGLVVFGLTAALAIVFEDQKTKDARQAKDGQKTKDARQAKEDLSALPLKGVTLLSKAWVKVRKAWDDGKTDSTSHNGADHEK